MTEEPAWDHVCMCVVGAGGGKACAAVAQAVCFVVGKILWLIL